ncbi:phosphatase PAP2 family protein [Anaerocolumna sp. AGMB13025]|uniref:phosphatase PAP2 family protein n=1 Tax=Anaerocolumna sp. AGMB13025 TaxID=3039116 RepID=UPI00241FBFF9|nr:phosphatase PAP2 family protein [Anaerocolumna sp. AGMB13025]WFR57198.1 phosphatase PAP2 family protein [Anaerocolumna sp. AGMB13025]
MGLLQSMDESILFYILEHFHTPLLDKIMIVITTLGNSGFIWLIIAALLLIPKKTRYIGIFLFLALCTEYLLGDMFLKPLIARPRPFIRFPEIDLLIKRPGSFSFPSGHTMSSFTAATVIFWANKRAGISAYILAVLIGFSRLYLFCHYPTDVLSGAVLGTLTALFVITFAKSFPKQTQVKQ